MGNGASAGIAAAALAATEADLTAALSELSVEDRTKLSAALGSGSNPETPEYPYDESVFADLLQPGSGCEIPQTEDRAITVEQLKAVTRHIKRRCVKEGWMGGYPDKKPLTPKEVNLYDTCTYVIKVRRRDPLPPVSFVHTLPRLQPSLHSLPAVLLGSAAGDKGKEDFVC